MGHYSARVNWSEEDSAFIAVCPEFPDLSAFGDTPENAVGELQSVVAAAIEIYEEDGEPLPEPDYTREFSGKLHLRLPKRLHSNLTAMAGNEGVSLNQFIVNALTEAYADNRAARAVNSLRLAVQSLFRGRATEDFSTYRTFIDERPEIILLAVDERSSAAIAPSNEGTQYDNREVVAWPN